MMWQWLKRRNMLPRGESAPTSTAPQRRRQAGAEQLLFDYLEERYAQTVVLTFEQIEDLLGTGLPEPARRDGGWWLEPRPETGGRPAPAARAPGRSPAERPSPTSRRRPSRSNASPEAIL